MKNTILMAATALCLAATPGLAGNDTLTNSAGDKLRISCKNSGCDVKIKKADAKKYARVEKTKGGTKNYNLLVAKYNGMGFK